MLQHLELGVAGGRYDVLDGTVCRGLPLESPAGWDCAPRDLTKRPGSASSWGCIKSRLMPTLRSLDTRLAQCCCRHRSRSKCISRNPVGQLSTGTFTNHGFRRIAAAWQRRGVCHKFRDTGAVSLGPAVSPVLEKVHRGHIPSEPERISVC